MTFMSEVPLSRTEWASEKLRQAISSFEHLRRIRDAILNSKRITPCGYGTGEADGNQVQKESP